MNAVIDNTHPDYEWVKESGLSLTDIIELGIKTAKIIQCEHLEDVCDLQADNQYDTHDDSQYLTILNEINKLSVTMTGSSAAKGRASEDTVFNNMCRLFPHAEIEHTGKESGKGDIVVKMNGRTIMVEVKNYSNNVPTHEQYKFINDLVTNEYDAGVMISINTGIANRSSTFEHSMIGDKFAVYLSNAGSDGESLSWAILFIVASLDITSKLQDDAKETKALVITYVENKLDVIKQCILDNDNIKRHLSNMSISLKRTIDNELTRCDESIKTANCKLTSLISNFNTLMETGELDNDMSLLYTDKEAPKQLCDMKKTELVTMAKVKGIKKISNMKRDQLIDAIRSS